MEIFLPSVLIIIFASIVVFFLLPRFGPLTLAIISVVLLGFGVYQHSSQFGSEYRLSTWQVGLTAYAPYVMVGALILSIALYILYMVPSSTNTSSTATPITMPTIANMPSSNTSTNPITSAINSVINTVANGVKNNAKNNTGVMGNLLNFGPKANNNKGLGFPYSQI